MIPEHHTRRLENLKSHMSLEVGFHDQGFIILYIEIFHANLGGRAV
jgi:hypothetical protein